MKVVIIIVGLYFCSEHPYFACSFIRFYQGAKAIVILIFLSCTSISKEQLFRQLIISLNNHYFVNMNLYNILLLSYAGLWMSNAVTILRTMSNVVTILRTIYILTPSPPPPHLFLPGPPRFTSFSPPSTCHTAHKSKHSTNIESD